MLISIVFFLRNRCWIQQVLWRISPPPSAEQDQRNATKLGRARRWAQSPPLPVNAKRPPQTKRTLAALNCVETLGAVASTLCELEAGLLSLGIGVHGLAPPTPEVVRVGCTRRDRLKMGAWCLGRWCLVRGTRVLVFFSMLSPCETFAAILWADGWVGFTRLVLDTCAGLCLSMRANELPGLQPRAQRRIRVVPRRRLPVPVARRSRQIVSFSVGGILRSETGSRFGGGVSFGALTSFCAYSAWRSKWERRPSLERGSSWTEPAARNGTSKHPREHRWSSVWSWACLLDPSLNIRCCFSLRVISDAMWMHSSQEVNRYFLTPRCGYTSRFRLLMASGVCSERLWCTGPPPLHVD